MIVTEEEAKTKRCQESFGSHGAFTDAVPEPGREIVTATRYCIGSACMAWRWYNDGLSDYPPDTKGYCGKSGGP